MPKTHFLNSWTVYISYSIYSIITYNSRRNHVWSCIIPESLLLLIIFLLYPTESEISYNSFDSVEYPLCTKSRDQGVLKILVYKVFKLPLMKRYVIVRKFTIRNGNRGINVILLLLSLINNVSVRFRPYPLRPLLRRVRLRTSSTSPQVCSYL